MSQQAAVVVLISGGLDSTALIDFFLRRKASVKCIHFQYGQPNGKGEAEAVHKITQFYKLDEQVEELRFPLMLRRDEVVGRNVMFVIAASCLKQPPFRLALGIHSGTAYYDCSKSFIIDCQKLLDGYFGGTVRLEAPFLKFGKVDIANYCKTNNVPTHLTYSCQRQDYPPCGNCGSCRDRRKFVGC
jgi:7-cyano-7-deazaguanine synthase